MTSYLVVRKRNFRQCMCVKSLEAHEYDALKPFHFHSMYDFVNTDGCFYVMDYDDVAHMFSDSEFEDHFVAIEN